MLKPRSHQRDSLNVDLHQPTKSRSPSSMVGADLATQKEEPPFKNREIPVAVGHQLSLADADWPTGSDGLQPLPAAERTDAIDPI